MAHRVPRNVPRSGDRASARFVRVKTVIFPRREPDTCEGRYSVCMFRLRKTFREMCFRRHAARRRRGGRRCTPVVVEPLELRLLMSTFFGSGGGGGGGLPTLDHSAAFSSYLGDAGSDQATDVAVDSAGNVYVVGTTESPGWVSGGPDTLLDGAPVTDAFLVKFDTEGNHLWSTYIGGDAADRAQGVAIDRHGDVVVVGFTADNGWLTTTTDPQYSTAGFVAKLDSDGNMIWSAGVGDATIYDVDIDRYNNIVIGGRTTEQIGDYGSFFTFEYGTREAFTAKLDSEGAIDWLRYLGGGGSESALAVAVDSQDNVLVGGYTASGGWVSGGYDTTYAYDTAVTGSVTYDGYLVKLDPDGQEQWSTLLGSIYFERVYGIDTDYFDNIYVVGTTQSDDWISGGFDEEFSGHFDSGSPGYDGFVVSIDPAGQHRWSSLVGGVADDFAYGVAVNNGGVYVTGRTKSDGWVSGGPDTTLNVPEDMYNFSNAFVLKASLDGAHLWSSYVGGDTQDEGLAIALDGARNVIVAGGTESSGWITDGWDITHGGDLDGFVTKLPVAVTGDNHAPQITLSPIAAAVVDGRRLVPIGTGAGLLFQWHGWSITDVDGDEYAQVEYYADFDRDLQPDSAEPYFELSDMVQRPEGSGGTIFVINEEQGSGSFAAPEGPFNILVYARDNYGGVSEPYVFESRGAYAVEFGDGHSDEITGLVNDPISGYVYEYAELPKRLVFTDTDGTDVAVELNDRRGSAYFSGQNIHHDVVGDIVTVTGDDLVFEGVVLDWKSQAGSSEYAANSGDLIIATSNGGDGRVAAGDLHVPFGLDAIVAPFVDVVNDFTFSDAIAYSDLAMGSPNRVHFGFGQAPRLNPWNPAAMTDITVPLATDTPFARQIIFTDADGTDVIIDVRGREADAEFSGGNVQFAQVGSRMMVTGDQLQLDSLTFVDGAGGSLVISARGGDGRMTVGDIVINGDLGNLIGRTTDVLGDVTISGAARVIQLGDIADNHLLSIGGTPDDSVVVMLGRVADTTLESGSGIRLLRVIDWVDTDDDVDTIVAPWIGTLLATGDRRGGVDGDFEAGLTLSGDGAVSATLGGARFAGALRDVAFDIVGDVGAILGGDVSDASIMIGGGSLRSAVFGRVTDLALDVAGDAGSIVVTDWLGGALTADTLRQWLTRGDRRSGVAGDAELDITLDNIDGAPAAFVNLRVAGAVLGGVWDITGGGSAVLAGSIDAAWTLLVSGDLRVLSVLGDMGGSIKANSIVVLSARGDMVDATVALMQGVDESNPRVVSLGRFGVFGAMVGSEVKTAGSIGGAVIGRMVDSRLAAGVMDGVEGLPEDGGDYDALASIGSVVVRGVRGGADPAFVGSDITANTLGVVTLGLIDPANSGVPFGVATTGFRGLRFATADGAVAFRSVAEATAATFDDDFVVRIV
ncbi:MAG: hypothetical protein GC159_18795 [Phycisphaera sp.]|nr:hypothetical protein [Phycisphaera sp.]